MKRNSGTLVRYGFVVVHLPLDQVEWIAVDEAAVLAESVCFFYILHVFQILELRKASYMTFEDIEKTLKAPGQHW